MRERELKLSLTAAEAGRLQSRLGSPLRVLRQRNHYLDTSGERLRARGIALRLREESSPSLDEARYILTAKGPSTREDAAHDREEVEVPLPAAEAQRILADGIAPEGSDLEPLRWAAAEAGGKRILALGSIENLRAVFPLPDLALELELDRTTYPDGSVEYELEVEYPPEPSGVDDAVLPAVRALLGSAGIPWRPSPAGKFRRFLERRGGA